MKVQTIFKAGNSDVVSIPAFIKRAVGVETGMDVVMSVASDGKTILLNKAGDTPNLGITPEFQGWLDKFNKKYGSALKTLANK